MKTDDKMALIIARQRLAEARRNWTAACDYVDHCPDREMSRAIKREDEAAKAFYAASDALEALEPTT